MSPNKDSDNYVKQDAGRKSPFIITSGTNPQIIASHTTNTQKLYENLDQFTFNVLKVLKNPLKLFPISESCDSRVKVILSDIDAIFYVLAKCVDKCTKTNTSFSIHWSTLIKHVQKEFAKIVSALNQEDSTLSALCKDRLDGQVVKLMDLALNDCPTFLDPKQMIHPSTSSATPVVPTLICPASLNFKKRSRCKNDADTTDDNNGKRYKFDYNAADVFAKNLPLVDMTRPLQQHSTIIADNTIATKRRKTTGKSSKDKPNKNQTTSLWYCPVCLKRYHTRVSALKHIAKGEHKCLGLCRYPECDQHRHSIPKFAAHKRDHLINDEQNHLFFVEEIRSWRARLPTDKTSTQLIEEWTKNATSQQDIS